jgi:hypothetical protein
MGEVIRLAAAARSIPAPLTRPTHQMPYEKYLAYQQAEAAFSALFWQTARYRDDDEPPLGQDRAAALVNGGAIGRHVAAREVAEPRAGDQAATARQP